MRVGQTFPLECLPGKIHLLKEVNDFSKCIPQLVLCMPSPLHEQICYVTLWVNELNPGAHILVPVPPLSAVIGSHLTMLMASSLDPLVHRILCSIECSYAGNTRSLGSGSGSGSGLRGGWCPPEQVWNPEYGIVSYLWSGLRSLSPNLVLISNLCLSITLYGTSPPPPPPPPQGLPCTE